MEYSIEYPAEWPTSSEELRYFDNDNISDEFFDEHNDFHDKHQEHSREDSSDSENWKPPKRPSKPSTESYLEIYFPLLNCFGL